MIRYFADAPDVSISLVVSNRSDAYALVRAQRLGIPSAVLPKADFNDAPTTLALLRRYEVDFIVLAGFLLLVPQYLIDAFPRKIINLHPALLPKYGGKGMYGHHVHEAVKAAGEKETGITIHYIDKDFDRGEIIAQFRTALSPSDSVEDIEAKIHELEQAHFPEVIARAVSTL
ncbi:MAG: phosphoribosylglycinamide formyltransferase [Fibrobacter sp.]|nr:phosphoribosylglycinamide formyltransferase [Fibrobacter sp.]